jgi:hypothetical protein
LHRENDWSFQFGGDGGLSIESPWRIIVSGRIALADEDDGQKFGLPAPINAAARAMELLAGMKIVSVDVSSVSADLRVQFNGSTVLEVFNNSSGYEAWHAVVAVKPTCVHVVAQGGGELATWEG